VIAVRLARSPAVFTAVSLVLAAALVPGAFLRGEVLSQGTLLFEHEPWASHAPEDAAPANPLLHDAAYLFYPLLTHAVETIRQGELPLWSAALYGGHPFLASFQTALFSPFTAIALVVPLPHATVVKALAPLVVGGLGMFLYVRSLGLTAGAAWFAGLAFLLNGFSVAWIEHPLTAVACWLPWILHASDALSTHGDGRRAAGLAVLVSLAIVAGHPETTTKVLLLAGAYALTRLVLDARGAATPGARCGQRWIMTLVAFGAGALLTSIQVVPFVEYLSRSEALLSREAASLNTYFLPAATLVTGLVPDFFGNPAIGPYHVPPNRYGVVANYAEQALYAGIAVVVLAAVGAASRWHEWRVRFFALSGLIALGLMFGVPGLVHAISVVPFLSVMILTRFGLVAIAALIVLAAYGIDSQTRDGPTTALRANTKVRRHEVHEHTSGSDSRASWLRAFVQVLSWAGSPWRCGAGALADARRMQRVVLMVTVAVSLAVAVAWAVGLELLRTHDLAARTAVGSALALGLLLVVSTVILLRVRGRLSPLAFSVAICTVLAADLVAAGSGFHPTVPAEQVYPPVPELDMIRRDPGLFRVYGWGNALVPNAAMAYRLQDARGWDGMNPHRYTRLLDLGYLRQTSEPARHLRDPRLLDLLNVKYVFVEPGITLPGPRYTRVPGTRAPLYVNTQALPRAFLVHDYRVLAEPDMQAALHDGSVDLARVVLLDEELPEPERPEAASGGAPGTVTIREYRNTHVELEVNAPRRSLLVLSDAHYPGWTATVGDRRVPIRRANYALRAIAVPPGLHLVRFEYRPWPLRVGAMLSAVTLAGIVILALPLPFVAAAGQKPPAVR
jgi:hypothetical protein